MAQHIDVLKVFFQGREELLRVVNSNESIVKALSNVQNPVCPLIGTDITLVKKIGRGKMGVVFEIDFPDRGPKRYVAKMADVSKQLLAIFRAPPPGFPPVTFMDIQNMYYISAEMVISYNGLTAAPTDNITKDVIVPLFKKSCSLRKDLVIPRLDGRGNITLRPFDQVCETAYTEFVMALLVGELQRSGQSINFLDTFYFATCINGTKLTDVKQYTFMEKIDNSLRKSLGCITEIDYSNTKNPNYRPEVVECVTIQILHAIAMYQSVYQIVHGDLHDDNVFLEYVTGDTVWKGEKVLDVDYYQYNIPGASLFLPGGRECPFIVKIGDWGLSCKYSSPIIAENTTIYTGYDQRDGHGAWLPNFYTTAYDPVLIVSILSNLNPSNEFLQGIMAWMFGLPAGYNSKDIANAKENIFNKGTGRPSMKSLGTTLAHVSPLAILSNKDLMGRYLEEPTDPSKSILFGELK